MLTTVLFDLDGTLLPMDQEAFVTCYLGLMAKRMAPAGYTPDALISTIWKGSDAMYRNDGSETNESAFWNVFVDRFGEKALGDKALYEDFYRNEFQQAAKSCGFDPRARETVDAIHRMGLKTVLATNPLFPAIATESRVRWAGLQPEDFLLITTYENYHYCKPNLLYFQEILSRLQLKPGECVMVGNDASEDLAAGQLGIRVFLLTDCLINKKSIDISHVPQGSYPELISYLETQL